MKSLSCYAQAVVGDEVWISNNRFNGLFRVNLKSGTAAFAGRFPEHKLEDEELHLFAKIFKDKIFFFPKRSENIDIYNLKTGKFSYVPCRTNNINGYASVIDAFRFDEDRVVIIPCYPGMPLQELSIEKEAIVKSIELKRSNQHVNSKTNVMTLYACRMKDEIFYPIHGTNKVGSYHLKEETEKIYSIDGLKSILGDIVFDGEVLWLNADQGIYRWDPYKNSLNLVHDYLSEKEGWIEKFVLYNQDIIGIPRWLKNIKIIDRHNFKQREVKIDRFALNKNMDMPWRDVRECFVWQENLIIAPVKYKESIYINLNNYKIEYKNWEILEGLPIKAGVIVHERAKEDLRDFILTTEKNNRICHNLSGKCTGYSIWQKINSNID